MFGCIVWPGLWHKLHLWLIPLFSQIKIEISFTFYAVVCLAHMFPNPWLLSVFYLMCWSTKLAARSLLGGLGNNLGGQGMPHEMSCSEFLFQVSVFLYLMFLSPLTFHFSLYCGPWLSCIYLWCKVLIFFVAGFLGATHYHCLNTCWQGLAKIIFSLWFLYLVMIIYFKLFRKVSENLCYMVFQKWKL